jgi:hypothetical protein
MQPLQLGFKLSSHMSCTHCAMPAGVVPYPVPHSFCAKPMAEPHMQAGVLCMNEGDGRFGRAKGVDLEAEPRPRCDDDETGGAVAQAGIAKPADCSTFSTGADPATQDPK